MRTDDVYFFQIIRKYNESNGGIEAAYKEVCRHLEEVEAAKRALEEGLEIREKEISYAERLEKTNQMLDEIIQMFEDAGYGLKSDDWKTNWEEMIDHMEKWEKKRKEKREKEAKELNEIKETHENERK